MVRSFVRSFHAPLGVGVDLHVLVNVGDDLLAGENVENAVTSQHQELVLRSYLRKRLTVQAPPSKAPTGGRKGEGGGNQSRFVGEREGREG